MEKFYHPFNPYPPFMEDYTDVPVVTEPDQSLSLHDIITFSASGMPLNVGVYDDYDDSEEGAQFDLGMDQFDYANYLRGYKYEKLDPPTDPPADPPTDPPTDPPIN